MILARVAAIVAVWGVLAPLETTRAEAETVRAAVAANLRPAIGELVSAFEAATPGAAVTISVGATGALYAQIVNGAPFDLFLAADVERPARLVAAGLAAPGAEPIPYALGALALIAAEPGRAPTLDALRAPGVRVVALPNPKTAPYGAAAVAALKHFGLWEGRGWRVAKAQNVAGAFAAVRARAAEFGFVALSAARASGAPHWEVPGSAHPPLRQDFVLLTRGAAKNSARAFARFLTSAAARKILARHGYRFE